jgi:hypothetical protein
VGDEGTIAKTDDQAGAVGRLRACVKHAGSSVAADLERQYN